MALKLVNGEIMRTWKLESNVYQEPLIIYQVKTNHRGKEKTILLKIVEDMTDYSKMNQENISELLGEIVPNDMIDYLNKKEKEDIEQIKREEIRLKEHKERVDRYRNMVFGTPYDSSKYPFHNDYNNDFWEDIKDTSKEEPKGKYNSNVLNIADLSEEEDYDTLEKIDAFLTENSFGKFIDNTARRIDNLNKNNKGE